MSQVTPASDIIREAEAVSELTIDEMATEKFNGNSLTAALYFLSLDESYVDDQFGDVDSIGHYARIDRWIIETDSAGNVTHSEYIDERSAIDAMAEERSLCNGERDIAW